MRLAHIGRMGLIATSLIGSLALGGGSLALAQDASPAASPTGPCMPNSGITEATPAAATPEATPAVAVELASTPADDATIAQATAFIQNISNCAATPEDQATLVTPNFVLQLGGYATVEDALADGFFEETPQFDVTRVVTYDDGSLGVNVNYSMTEYQYVSQMWNLVNIDGEWKADAVSEGDPLELDGDTTALGVTLLENGDGTYTITPASTDVEATDNLVLQAINDKTNKEAHELVVLKLPEGADPAGLFDGSIDQKDIEFIGQVTVATPGDSADMTLVNLPVGMYTLVCFFPAPDGSPHAMHGMVAPFEVKAPATS